MLKLIRVYQVRLFTLIVIQSNHLIDWLFVCWDLFLGQNVPRQLDIFFCIWTSYQFCLVLSSSWSDLCLFLGFGFCQALPHVFLVEITWSKYLILKSAMFIKLRIFSCWLFVAWTDKLRNGFGACKFCNQREAYWCGLGQKHWDLWTCCSRWKVSLIFLYNCDSSA